MGERRTYSQFFSGTALVFAGTIVSLGLAFGIRVILARLLGPDEYGLVTLGFTSASLVLILAKVGLPRGVAREMPRTDAENARDIALSGLSLATVSGAVFGMLLWLSAPVLATNLFGDTRLTPIIAVFAVLVPFEVVTQQVVGTFQGREQASERVFITNLFIPLSRFVMVAAAVILGFEAFGAAAAWVGSMALTAVVAVALLFYRTDYLSSLRFEGEYRPLLKFSIPLMLSAAMWNVVQQADNIVIGAYLQSEAVGWYDAAFSLGKLILAALGAFGFLFIPMLSRLEAEGNNAEMIRFYKTATKWVASLTLPLFLIFVLFPREILAGIYGENFVAATATLQILALGFYFHVLSGLAGNALVSIGRVRIIMYANVGIAALNLAGNVILVPRFGIEGAAAMSALSYTVLNIGYLWVLRGYGVSPVSRQLMVPMAITTSVVVPIGSTFTSDIEVSLPLVVAILFVTTVFHFMAYLFFGIEETDIEIIDTAEDKLGIGLAPIKTLLRNNL